MSSFEDISKLFYIESTKLESAINNASTKSKLTPAEIVPIYYQIMNVDSLIALLNQEFNKSDRNSAIGLKIKYIQKLISEKFNVTLHKSILADLTFTITDITKKLSSTQNGDKSKDDIESEAKLYEQLRQIMSTKEFVEQYDKGLSYD